MGVEKKRVLVTVYTCERCGHEWLPRKPFDPIDFDALPKTCSNCNNPNWNMPKDEDPDRPQPNPRSRRRRKK